MYAVRYFFFSVGGVISTDTNMEKINFALLVFSTLLIAAAGNIINDYFDIKADKINKPEKLIVSTSISKRNAIKYHWYLSGIAIIIAIFLSLYYHSLSYIFIHVLAINLLWLYSAYFKKKMLLGNLLIASLTALVIVLSGIHLYHVCDFLLHPNLDGKISIHPSIEDAVFHWKNVFLNTGNFVILLSVFAFILNLGREIVKDIEDVTGDKEIHAHTLPITLGIKKTKGITVVILTLIPLLYLLLIYRFGDGFNSMTILATFPVFLATMLTFLSTLILLFTSYLRVVNNLLKLAMLLGVLTPFYWWLV
jgi:4-hydroxybenzoate polyprenyltransferase